MFLLIWALNKEARIYKDNMINAYDTLQIALAAANCQMEDSMFEEVVFEPIEDFNFGYHDVIQAWTTKQGEILIIIKMEIKNDI